MCTGLSVGVEESRALTVFQEQGMMSDPGGLGAAAIRRIFLVLIDVRVCW